MREEGSAGKILADCLQGRVYWHGLRSNVPFMLGKFLSLVQIRGCPTRFQGIVKYNLLFAIDTNPVSDMARGAMEDIPVIMLNDGFRITRNTINREDLHARMV